MNKILIIEDDEDLCNLIYQIVKDEGFEAEMVYDGNDALKKIKSDDFNLMITDNRLTGISGIKVLEELKNNPIKKIMISAYGSTDTRLKAYNLGVTEFIDKPFDISSLIEGIHRSLSTN